MDRKLHTLTSIIYTVRKKRFSLEAEKVRKEPPKANKRYRKPETRTQTAKARILSQFKHREAQSVSTTRHSDLYRMQRAQERKHGKESRRLAFTANHQICKKPIGEGATGVLESPIDVVDSYLHRTHSDVSRDHALADCERIESALHSEIMIDISESSLRNIKSIVEKAMPLLRLLKVIWRKGKGVVPESWKKAKGIFTQKKLNSWTINTKEVELVDNQPVPDDITPKC